MDQFERSGLRLQLLRQQAKAGDIVLLFGDESEVSTHPYLAHMWALRGQDLRIQAPGQAKKRALLGVRDGATGHLEAITSATKRSSDFIDLLTAIDVRYQLDAGYAGPPIVMVLDNGSIHRSKASLEAIASRPYLKIEWLPPYASELNDIERDWRTLKRLYLANQAIFDLVRLDALIHLAISSLNDSRRRASCAPFGQVA